MFRFSLFSRQFFAFIYLADPELLKEFDTSYEKRLGLFLPNFAIFRNI